MLHPMLEAGLPTSSNSFCAGLSFLVVHVYCFGSPPPDSAARRSAGNETANT